MKNKYFTIMIVPDAHSTVRRVQLRKSLVYGAALAGLLVVALVSAVVVHYAYIVDETFAAKELREENLALQGRITTLQDKVEGVDKELEELAKFDSKLREMTQLNDDRRGLAMGPLQSGTDDKNAQPNEIAPFATDLKPEDPAAQELRDALLDSRLAGLAHEARRQMRSLSGLVDYYKSQESLLASTPSVWPVRGFLTSGFGARVDPYTQETVMHSGVDLGANHGAKVVAPAKGTVLFSGVNGAYGNMIRIDHGRGLTTHYAHLSRILVKVGDEVKRGQHIGAVGNTGRSTGPHLHYEVRRDQTPINPKLYVLE